jgi:KDO2-lipid IV(A) lauroyltransferase
MFLLKLLSRLPFSVLFAFADLLFFVTYYVVRYRRRLVKKQLKTSFPEKTSAELDFIEKEFYKNLCDYSVETLKLLTITKEEMLERMQFKNPEFLQQFSSKNQSILFLSSHQFNWEWSLAAASICFPMAIDFVYQPVNNGFFEKLSLEARTRFGAYPIKREAVAREFVNRKTILRGVATVADQYPGYKKDKKYTTQFLNQETVFFLGTNNMAILSQYPTIYYTIKKIGRGYYEALPKIVALPPYNKSSTKVLDNYVRIVEKDIQAYPQGWLWSHNRWKKRHLEKEN